MNKFLTISEVAELFNVSKATVTRLMDKRKLSFYKIGGVIRFSQEDIDHYLEDNKWEWSKHPRITI